MAMPMYKGGSNKTIQANIKLLLIRSHNVQKCSLVLNTIDLMANPDTLPKIHFNGHISPSKSHLSSQSA